MSNDNKMTTEDRETPGLRPPLPGGVGSKFYPDGRVRPFPGNTIICHVPEGRARDGLLDLHARLSGLGLGPSVSMLPTASLHMTLFEGVCDQIREPGRWPDDLAADAPLGLCDAHFEQKLRQFDLACDPPYLLRYDGLERLRTGLVLQLLPIDVDEDRRLRDLRDRLSALLRLRPANHAPYRFHVSFAYIIRELSQEQSQRILQTVADWKAHQPLLELGAPEFCTFADMFHFDRQFYLGVSIGAEL